MSFCFILFVIFFYVYRVVLVFGSNVVFWGYLLFSVKLRAVTWRLPFKKYKLNPRISEDFAVIGLFHLAPFNHTFDYCARSSQSNRVGKFIQSPLSLSMALLLAVFICCVLSPQALNPGENTLNREIIGLNVRRF